MKPTVKDGILRAGEEATAVPSSEHHHSPEWCAWLVEHDQFRFVGEAGHFSARWTIREATIAASVLQAKGIANVIKLEDGYNGWAAAGLPIERNGAA